MLIISLATASTVLTLNTFKKGDDGEPVPEVWQKIFFDVVAKILFLNVKVNRNLNKTATVSGGGGSPSLSSTPRSSSRFIKTSPVYETNGFLLTRDHLHLSNNDTDNLVLKSIDDSRPTPNPQISDQKTLRLMRILNTKLERYERLHAIQKQKEEIKNQWSQLAKVIDALLAYIFVLTSLSLLFYLVSKTPNISFY